MNITYAQSTDCEKHKLGSRHISPAIIQNVRPGTKVFHMEHLHLQHAISDRLD